jgi:hypothetical protein
LSVLPTQLGVFFMKKYMLPTLISLALSPTWILAQEAATTPPPAATPESPAKSSTPAATKTVENKTPDLMKKHQEHRNYMREQMEKLSHTDDPEERERIREEMRQHQEDMQKEMWESGSMPGWGGDPSWGGPRWGGPWGGPGPRWGGPNWDNPGPQWGGGPSYYDMPPGRAGNAPNFCDKKPLGGHQAKMEQRLENIEKLLQQIADSLAKQEKK